ncbi:MAG: hypothetical protein H6709_05190 [Kofleriaceae bacterium]|nr:hypothetical protein [Kofleriaceae bacterium]MCB9571467.1 hypothetical protein [Kofleriaceae bacterium]
MTSWRTYAIAALVIVATSVVGGELTSIHVVLPPMIAALVVLIGAALSVDYFGFSRRQLGWHGMIQPTTATRARLRALEHQFHRERRAGSMRTPATARTLLIALAEHGELRHADAVVDFLAADAATRAHADVVADALRALALAELGRLPQARLVEAALGARAGTSPVVAYARGRIAELGGAPAEALAHVERGLPRAGAATALRRDLGVLRARLLVRCGRVDDARRELGDLARGATRGAVEALIGGGDAGVAQVAREALGLATAYR